MKRPHSFTRAHTLEYASKYFRIFTPSVGADLASAFYSTLKDDRGFAYHIIRKAQQPLFFQRAFHAVCIRLCFHCRGFSCFMAAGFGHGRRQRFQLRGWTYRYDRYLCPAFGFTSFEKDACVAAAWAAGFAVAERRLANTPPPFIVLQVFLCLLRRYVISHLFSRHLDAYFFG